MRSHSAEAVLEGQPISDEIIVRAAEAVAAEGRPRSSWRSSAEFRTRLLHDVTIAVVHEAIQRAAAADKAAPIPARLYPGQLGLLPRSRKED
jgi:Aerobic-type carbon monoxide dehydrogenase, middle subunit CoxM/CutM homologs